MMMDVVLADAVEAIDAAKAPGTSCNYSVVSTEQVGGASSNRSWWVAALSSPASGVKTPSCCDLLKCVQL